MHLNIQNVTFHLINVSTILTLESRYTILYTNWLIKIKHVNSCSTDPLIYYCFGVIDVGPKDWWPLCSSLHWMRFVPQQISVWGLCILLFLPTNPSVLKGWTVHQDSVCFHWSCPNRDQNSNLVTSPQCPWPGG